MWYKKLIIYAVFVCLICGSGYSDSQTQIYYPRVGEVLAYKVMAKSFIYGADQIIKVISNGEYENHKVFNIQYTFNTTGLVWSLTKYREHEELVLDEEGMYPLYTKREIHENGKLRIEETTFDYKAGFALRSLNINGKSESSRVRLPGFVQDNLSLQFFLRKIPLEEGRKKLFIYSYGTVDEVDCEIAKINAPIKLECGSYSQYYQITSDEAKITLILSNDAERLPLVIRKIADFGKVEARLSQIN